ncbi:hypothetical protein HOY80DRAFT_9413 [Tuber brumale]|nr:hypothetical protein HOY80DRAFT_9413 [Tuber brumale]
MCYFRNFDSRNLLSRPITGLLLRLPISSLPGTQVFGFSMTMGDGSRVGTMLPNPQRSTHLETGFFSGKKHVHTMFDQYLISANPDDGYKVVVFDFDLYSYDGKTLDPVCRNPDDPHSVSDELLRWHFRQSVLANVRGAGEPIFEHDFPPGTDMVGEILAGPYAREI